MRIIIFVILLLLHALIVFGQSHERGWYQVFDPHKAEETEKKDFIEKSAFFSLSAATIEDSLLVIEITAGFDYENYLIKNERRFLGSSDKELDKMKLDFIKNDDFKKEVITWVNDKKKFNKKYFLLDNIFSLRLECISRVWYANKEDKNEVAKNLSPGEASLYLSLKKADTNDRRYYFSRALELFNAKEEALFNKYDFQKISETDPEITIPNCLNLLLKDGGFYTTRNMIFLSDLLRPNSDKPIDIQIGIQAIKVWQKYKNHRIAIVDAPLLQANLLGFTTEILDVLKISDYQKHEAILKEVLTPEVYQKFFIDKMDFADIEYAYFRKPKN